MIPGMDQAEIYEEHADEYEALVRAEDCDGNLLPAIARVIPLRGAEVLEVGAGTGRITRLLVGAGARVVAVDRAEAMLAVARRKLDAMSAKDQWRLLVADARALPVGDGWANLAIAGWVFGHLRYWMPEGWRDEVGKALAEMRRALVPGGAMILIETLGTGRERAEPPSPELAEYVAWLEAEHGFSRTVIRTDYVFPSVEEAAATAGFFFGEAFGARVREKGSARIPEFTGVWSARAAGPVL